MAEKNLMPCEAQDQLQESNPEELSNGDILKSEG
jgi:hypothetical protein